MIGSSGGSFSNGNLEATPPGGTPHLGFQLGNHAITRRVLRHAPREPYTLGMAQTNSPITGIIDEGAVIVDFGKYEGKSIKQVAEVDPAFYQTLVGEREKGVYAIRRHRDKTFRLYINPLAQIEN